MNRPQRMPDLDELRKIDSQLIRLHTFIDSAVWADVGATGEKHGPIFTVKTDLSRFSGGWVLRQSSAIGGNTTFAATVHEREAGLEYNVGIKMDSRTVVKAKRNAEQSEHVTWGPKKAAYEDVLRQFQLYREQIK